MNSGRSVAEVFCGEAVAFSTLVEIESLAVTNWYHAFHQGIYVTEVHEGSAASAAGLKVHDKILQCNGYDFTMVTHKKAVGYICKHPTLNMLVARRGVTHN